MASGVPILTYHFVGDYPRQREHRSIFCHAPVFARQMRLLHRLGWRTMPLQELARRITEPRPLPPRRFVLTFDDGDADLRWSVAPVLRRCGFTATVFVVSGFLGETTEWEEDPTLRGRRLLSREDVREMAEEGWEIGAHTVSHTELTRLNAAGLEREVAGCRSALEALLGGPVLSFCYPSGEVTPQGRAAVAEAGYSAAVTTRKGRVQAGADPLLLDRIGISHRAGPLGLLWRMRTAPEASGGRLACASGGDSGSRS